MKQFRVNGVELHPLITSRRSGRLFDSRPVQEDYVRMLLESARWAPSCNNNQPWRFVVCQGGDLERIRPHLSRGNAWALKAPLIFVVVSGPELDCRIKGRDYYTLGLGLAIENMLLQGTAMDLVMHPIAGFREEPIKTELSIPDDYRIHVLIIAGHPGSRRDADPDLLAREDEPRRRHSLKELVSMGRWSSKLRQTIEP